MANNYGNNQNTNRSFRTEQPYMNKEDELRWLIIHTECGLCTDALMLFNSKATGESAIRQENFLQSVERICTEEHAAIWTSLGVIREVESIMRSNFVEKRRAADYAMSFLRRMNDNGKLYVYDDVESIVEICSMRLGQMSTPLSVITQSAALAEKIEALNRNNSAAPIKVRRVNMGGKISAFLPANQFPVNGTDSRRPQQYSGDTRKEATGNEYVGVPPVSAPIKGRRGPSSLVLSSISIEHRAISAPKEGEMVQGCRSGKSYRLGKYIDSGSEADVYMVEGDNDRVIKVYNAHVSDALEHKVKLLSSVRINGCALPEEAVYNREGVFCGYVMPRVKGVLLNKTFDEEWRKEREKNFLIEQTFYWTRADFIRAALRLLEIEKELMEHGIYVIDGRPENIMVAYDIDGHISPDHICLIDIDSAQVDTALISGGRERGFLAGGGVTASFIAPEVSLPFTSSTLLDVKTLAYQFCLQTFMVIMAGVHPFAARRDISVTADRSLRGAGQKGEFPYRISGFSSSCGLKAAEQSSYLFSYLPSKLKALMHETFSYDGKYFHVDKREGLFEELLEHMTYADQWFRDVRNMRKFDEMLSLSPSEFKPFKQKCVNPACVNHKSWRKVVDFPEKLTEDTVLKISDEEYLCMDCYREKYVNKTSAPSRMIQDGLSSIKRGLRSYFPNI